MFPLYDRNPRVRFPWITLLLIGANVFFFWKSIESGDQEEFAKVVLTHGFVPQRLTNIGEDQPIVIEQPIVVIDEKGREQRMLLQANLSTEPREVYPTLVTMMFLHGGWLHLLSNMWMLWVFGDNVEDRLGRFVFVFFYLVGGVVAILVQWATDPSGAQPVIGASGAVAAVLGAYLITFPSAKVRTLVFLGFPLLFDLPAFLVLGAWFAMEVLSGLQAWGAPEGVQVSIAFWAHVGGFLAGVLLMPMLTIGAQPPGEDWRAESREMFEI